MFSKVLAVATLVATVLADNLPASQCNVGHLQCCNNVQPASSQAASQALALIGVIVQGADVPIGIACTPIDVFFAVGASSNCAAQPVCCEDNNYNGVAAIGCVPVNVGA